MEAMFLLFASLAAAPAARGVRAEFGTNWNIVLALGVLNTVVVLFFLWRIWTEKLPAATTKRE